MPRRMRPHAARFVLLVFVAGLGAMPVRAQTATAPPVEAVWTTLWEHWYELELGGATAGWMRETVSERGEELRTQSKMELKISRGPVVVELGLANDFVETRKGAPVSMQFVQDMGQQEVNTRWNFRDDHVHTLSRQGGRELEDRLPLPEGTWLTPRAAHRFRLERMEAGADSIVYRTIDGESGIDPITMTHERTGAGSFEHDGRTIPVTIWKTTTSAMPGLHSVSKVSDDGHLLYDEAIFPFGRMVTKLTTREAALAAAGAPAPELMIRTFVRSDPPIDRARETTASKLRLRTREGPMPELPSAGAQRFELEPGGRTAILRIDTNENVPATIEETSDPAYAKPSATADADDVFIRKLAARAARRQSADPAARAEALRAYVHEHISAKSLDTAFATASETARTRTGDCSEHAVLLCAMMRADGIPARVATGLVYADVFAGEQDIFGWHMWTQANIDGHWVDFDATLDRRYDAAHVLTGTSSLADGIGGGDMASMLQLLGNLEVEVVDVTY